MVCAPHRFIVQGLALGSSSSYNSKPILELGDYQSLKGSEQVMRAPYEGQASAVVSYDPGLDYLSSDSVAKKPYTSSSVAPIAPGVVQEWSVSSKLEKEVIQVPSLTREVIQTYSPISAGDDYSLNPVDVGQEVKMVLQKKKQDLARRVLAELDALGHKPVEHVHADGTVHSH